MLVWVWVEYLEENFLEGGGFDVKVECFDFGIVYFGDGWVFGVFV